MLCKTCGKYHPILEQCYSDLPKDIMIVYTRSQLKHASDKDIVNELRKRGIIALPHPNPKSPEYTLPVLAPENLRDCKRITWRKYCIDLLIN